MSDLFGAPEPVAQDPDLDIVIADTHLASGTANSQFGERGLWPEYANPTLKGMESQEKLLLDMWRSGKFPHALAITGSKGIGKATLAFHLARYILENSVEHDAQSGALFGEEDAPVDTLAISQDSRTYSQVISGGHPDILTIGDFYHGEDEADPDYSPKIDDIRRVPSFLQKTSAYGGWRVVIVDNADHMNRNAQNAILKVLEEPPSKALLILVVHKEGAMLPTIKSRIRTLKCDPLPSGTVKKLLLQDDPSIDPDDIDLLTLVSNGSAARAIYFARAGGADLLKETVTFLSNIASLKDSDLLGFCEIMAQKNNAEKLAQWRTILIWVFELVIAAKGRNIDPFDGIDMSDQLGLQMTVQNFVSLGSVQDWLNGLEQLKQHFDQCDRQHLDSYHEVYTAITVCRDVMK